jgi:signal transduction histidine kinase
MSKGRLTRQELGWLLTQEAQGAAHRLRQGVQIMRSVPPPSMAESPAGGAPAEEPDVSASLDALDDMMRMLSNLHSRPPPAHARRGRIDLASILWEIAPEARVQIEPGAGTEVFGDEAELRRMLHILVGHGSGVGSSVSIHREGSEVKIGVHLGPDTSPTMETERAWMSRMAVRYGGRHELEGGMEWLIIPADAELEEREALRKELDEARRQGEAYARELAAVLDKGEEVAASSYPPPPLADGPDRLAALVRLSRGVAFELRATLGQAQRELAQVRAASNDDELENVKRRLARAMDLGQALASFGELDPEEIKQPLDLAEVVRTVAAPVGMRAEAAGVKLVVEPEASDARVAAHAPLKAAAFIVREIMAQAVASTPKGGTVRVAASSDVLGPRVVVDDGGTVIAASARRAFLSLEVDPGAHGRVSAIPLYVATEVAQCHGAMVELTDSPTGGLRVAVVFPRR